MSLPYTRSLHPDEYAHPELRPFVRQVLQFEHELRIKGIPFRKDHEHRTWEYANVLRQLDGLYGSKRVTLLDTGAGGSALAPMLARQGHAVTASDSMAYGDIVVPFIGPQAAALQLDLPCLIAPVENHAMVESGYFDVVCCVSVIEHVDRLRYREALAELVRMTKPGGFLFLTSDYFRDGRAVERSPYKQIQHTAFTADTVWQIPEQVPVEFIGEVDLTYHGDFVHTYSFVNMCFRKLT